MSKSRKTSSNAAIIATIVVALAAIAAMIILLVMMSGRDKEESSSDTGFHASQELFDECLYSAHDLVSENYKILKLYIIEGLPHKEEPYGNEPEDGIYTVDSEEYTTTTSSISGETLSKSSSLPVTVVLEYSDKNAVDGDFDVDFGSITLNYSSSDGE